MRYESCKAPRTLDSHKLQTSIYLQSPLYDWVLLAWIGLNLSFFGHRCNCRRLTDGSKPIGRKGVWIAIVVSSSINFCICNQCL